MVEIDEVILGVYHLDLIYELLRGNPDPDETVGGLVSDISPGHAIRTRVRELWDKYVAYGRERLGAVGELAAARPVFGLGAIGDLVIGCTMIEVKATSVPSEENVRGDLEQLLRYVLSDRDDTYRFDAVGAYYGDLPILVTQSLFELVSDLARDRGELHRLRDQYLHLSGL